MEKLPNSLYVMFFVALEGDYEEFRSEPLLVFTSADKAWEACVLADKMQKDRKVGFRYAEPHPLFPEKHVPVMDGIFKYVEIELVS